MPTYTLIEVVVNTMRGPVAAMTYVCADERDAIPVDDDRFALLTDAEVESAIALFIPTMRWFRGRSE